MQFEEIFRSHNKYFTTITFTITISSLLEGYRTFQPQNFQPRILQPRTFHPQIFQKWNFQSHTCGSGVWEFMVFNPGLFNHSWTLKLQTHKYGIDKFMFEKYGNEKYKVVVEISWNPWVEEFMLETSGANYSGNSWVVVENLMLKCPRRKS